MDRAKTTYDRFHMAKVARAHEIVRKKMLPLYRTNEAITGKLGVSRTTGKKLVNGESVGPEVLAKVFAWDDQHTTERKTEA